MRKSLVKFCRTTFRKDVIARTVTVRKNIVNATQKGRNALSYADAKVAITYKTAINNRRMATTYNSPVQVVK